MCNKYIRAIAEATLSTITSSHVLFSTHLYRPGALNGDPCNTALNGKRSIESDEGGDDDESKVYLGGVHV